MDTLTNDANSSIDQGQRKLGMGACIAASLTGTSTNELANAPDDEEKAVRLAAISLALISTLMVLGWWVALGIARGGFSPSNLPWAAMAGLIIFTIDRAMLRRLWVGVGRRAAARRGFQIGEIEGWLPRALHVLLRLSVTLILSLTIASFLDLEIFRHDTGWHVATENRELNRPLVVAAGERVDAIISAQREEIAHLSSHAAALLAEAAQHASAAGATKFARIEALAAERVDLRQRLDELTRQFACLNQDISAEHHGQARCDGLEARAGVGSRYNFAVDMAKFVQTERSAAAARLAEIDAHLALLDDPDDQADISLSTQGLLDRITAQRARMLVELERLTADRDAAVQAAALADPDFAPLPDGLIARGEALETLAKTSNWLAMRIWLVFLTIVVLDISAILVMSLMPAPQTVVLGEALTAEIAIRQALARAEQATSEAMASMFDARIRAAEAENVADERVSSLRAAIETRRMLNKQVNAELGRRFRKAA